MSMLDHAAAALRCYSRVAASDKLPQAVNRRANIHSHQAVPKQRGCRLNATFSFVVASLCKP